MPLLQRVRRHGSSPSQESRPRTRSQGLVALAAVAAAFVLSPHAVRGQSGAFRAPPSEGVRNALFRPFPEPRFSSAQNAGFWEKSGFSSGRDPHLRQTGYEDQPLVADEQGLASGTCRCERGGRCGCPPGGRCGCDCGLCPCCDGCYEPATQFIVRSGASIPLGNGFLEDHLDPGFAIDLSLRTLIERPRPGRWTPFTELGLGYAIHDGDDDERFFSPGAFFGGTPIFDNHVHDLPFVHKIDELERAWLQLAAGAIYTSPRLNRLLRGRGEALVRLGGRAGHVRVDYSGRATAAAFPLIDSHVGHGHDPSGLAFQSLDGFKDSETMWGLVGGVGFRVTYPEVCLRSLRLGDVSIGIECEFAHDWFNLKGDPRTPPLPVAGSVPLPGPGIGSDNGLFTLSALLTVAVTR